MPVRPTQEELHRRLAAKRAAGHPPRARQHQLEPGATVEGVVLRLPMCNASNGTWLYLRTAEETICIPAAGRRGHTVLERLLAEEHVAVGDRVRITYTGKRRTADGEREFRHYLLERRGG